jgi:hypothetical protein
MSWCNPLNLAKSIVAGWESTSTFVLPFDSVIELTVNWHETTLGSAASVATVKIEAEVIPEKPDTVVELPAPHPARTKNGRNSSSAATRFDPLISISFFSRNDDSGHRTPIPLSSTTYNTAAREKLHSGNRRTTSRRVVLTIRPVYHAEAEVRAATFWLPLRRDPEISAAGDLTDPCPPGGEIA